MSAENEALLKRFYDAFQARDGEAMAACYADDVWFSDPVFPELRGERARDMWRMLTGRAADLKVTYELRTVGAERGAVHWEAWYTFSATGRRVHNVIEAAFDFRDGRIVRHVDTFDFHRWSRQALGMVGLLLGWTSFLQGKGQAQADKALAAFSAKRPASKT